MTAVEPNRRSATANDHLVGIGFGFSQIIGGGLDPASPIRVGGVLALTVGQECEYWRYDE